MKHLEGLAQEVVVTFLRRDYPQALFTGGLAVMACALVWIGALVVMG